MVNDKYAILPTQMSVETVKYTANWQKSFCFTAYWHLLHITFDIYKIYSVLIFGRKKKKIIFYDKKYLGFFRRTIMPAIRDNKKTKIN